MLWYPPPLGGPGGSLGDPPPPPPRPPKRFTHSWVSIFGYTAPLGGHYAIGGAKCSG